MEQQVSWAQQWPGTPQACLFQLKMKREFCEATRSSKHVTAQQNLKTRSMLSGLLPMCGR